MFSVRAVVSLLLASQARAFSRQALRPLRAAKPCRSPPVRAVDLYDVGGTQVTFDAVNAFPVLSIVVLVGVANAVYMSLPDEQFDSLTAPLGDPFKKERPAGGDAEELAVDEGAVGEDAGEDAGAAAGEADDDAVAERDVGVGTPLFGKDK